MPPASWTERNGWKLYAHPAFSQRLEVLVRTVEALRRQQPESYRGHPKTKLLKRTLDLILVEIPRDPYRAFSRRLREGNPPDGWEDLLHEAGAAASRLDSDLERRLQ
jgi:hypothetical protein